VSVFEVEVLEQRDGLVQLHLVRAHLADALQHGKGFGASTSSTRDAVVQFAHVLFEIPDLLLQLPDLRVHARGGLVPVQQLVEQGGVVGLAGQAQFIRPDTKVFNTEGDSSTGREDCAGHT